MMYFISYISDKIPIEGEIIGETSRDIIVKSPIFDVILYIRKSDYKKKWFKTFRQFENHRRKVIKHEKVRLKNIYKSSMKEMIRYEKD